MNEIVFLRREPKRFVYSDASDTGCGATATLNEEHVCHELWDETERSQSSTWRELFAIRFALESFTELLHRSHVKWYTDNQAVAKIIEVGSMKLDLHLIAIKVFQFCLDHNIAIDIQWIPRAENERADFISHLIDPDDWEISAEFFQYLEVLWGLHTVDCFANYYNYKIPRFFSRF